MCPSYQYRRPGGGSQKPVAPTRHLYVANCGPGVGIEYEEVEQIFGRFGKLECVQPSLTSQSRTYVSFIEVAAAAAAYADLNGVEDPCSSCKRVMHIEFADVASDDSKVPLPCHVCRTSDEVNIPGLFLHTEFITPEEEKALVDATDGISWDCLSKRRVQHFGYEFKYKIRNVDRGERLGDLPAFVKDVVDRISLLPEVQSANEPCLPLDQLTVNEYPRGVGLSPHIDTHSAFEGAILSLSLAGPCVMEFRRYSVGSSGSEAESGVSKEHKHGLEEDGRAAEARSEDVTRECSLSSILPSKAVPAMISGCNTLGIGTERVALQQTVPAAQPNISTDKTKEAVVFGNGNGCGADSEEGRGGKLPEDNCAAMQRRAVFLPQRSLLVMLDEARYAWNHYIPHRKADIVNGTTIQRHKRRVSFTFRKVRHRPCQCSFQAYCDEDKQPARPTSHA